MNGDGALGPAAPNDVVVPLWAVAFFYCCFFRRRHPLPRHWLRGVRAAADAPTGPRRRCSLVEQLLGLVRLEPTRHVCSTTAAAEHYRQGDWTLVPTPPEQKLAFWLRAAVPLLPGARALCLAQ